MSSNSDIKNKSTRNIIISTREKGSSSELIELSRKSSVEVLEFPMIITMSASLSDEDIHIIRNIHDFNWIIFTSVNGVRFFFNLINKKDLEYIKKHVKIAVLSKKTGEALNKFKIVPAFIGKGPDSTQFIKELKMLFKDTENKVLFPTGTLTKNKIIENLKSNALISRVDLYETISPDNYEKNILKRIIENQYDMILFYSPSAVLNFYNLFKNLIDIHNIKVACIGPTTEKACVNLGITPIFTSEKPDSRCMFDNVLNYIKNNIK